MTPQLNLLFVHANHMGYGRMGVNVARELEALGIEVFDHLQGTKVENVNTGEITLRTHVPEHLNTGRKAGRCAQAVWLSVPGHGTGWWKGQTAHVFTMWEGMRLPESFREGLHRFETIVVPSKHNIELFSQFHDNVVYNPLGIDPAAWHYTPRRPHDRYFRFLIGGSGKRKGTDLAVKAFKKLWGKEGSWGTGPIPLLMLKNPKGEQFYGHRIDMHAGRLTDADEIALYEAAHCYLQPSRGEGFGLQPLQAIAQGIPTILTNAHGHEAFAHLGIPLSWKPVKADYFIYGDAGDWWEPDFDELCDAMRDVYENYEHHCTIAELAADAVPQVLTWAHTARRLANTVGYENMGPYVGPDEWFEVDQKKFKIITNRDWPCEIAGSQFFFERGKEFWQTADVKRILFEAGVLDPRCLDDTDPDMGGLTDQQVARADKYRAEYSNCPTCHRPLA